MGEMSRRPPAEEKKERRITGRRGKAETSPTLLAGRLAEHSLQDELSIVLTLLSGLVTKLADITRSKKMVICMGVSSYSGKKAKV